jgi:putative inorganic carbon (HCO3(-)) transporter
MSKDRLQSLWLFSALVLLTGAAPWLLFPDDQRAFMLIVLPVIWLLNRVFLGHFMPRTPYDLTILVLLVMVLLSVYATYDVRVSLPKIAGVLFGISWLYALVAYANSMRRLNWTLLGLIFGIVLLIGLIVLGTQWKGKVPLLNQLSGLFPQAITNVPGAPEGFSANEIGGTLTWVMLLPLSILIGLWSATRSRFVAKSIVSLLLIGLTLILTALIVLTQSRSAWLGAAAGIGVAIFAIGRISRVIVIGGLIVLIGAVLVIGPARLFSEITDSPTPQFGTLFEPKTEGRTEIWSRALEGIRDFPYTGLGMNTFRYLLPIMYPPFTIRLDIDLAHAHNEVLQAALDLGLPGAIAFISLHLIALGLAVNTLKRTATGLQRWVTIGALAGLAAHAVYGLTDAVALGAKPGIFFWILLGVLAAANQLGATNTGRGTEQSAVSVG